MFDTFDASPHSRHLPRFPTSTLPGELVALKCFDSQIIDGDLEELQFEVTSVVVNFFILFFELISYMRKRINRTPSG